MTKINPAAKKNSAQRPPATRRLKKNLNPKEPAASAQPEDLSGPETPSDALAQPGLTLQSSRRFWLAWVGAGLLVAGVIQGYGYLTGWGDPQRVVQRYFAQAQRLTLAKQYAAAIRSYQRVIDKNADGESVRQAMIALADVYKEDRQYAKAIAAYDRLRAQETESVMSAWAGLKIAESHLEAGQLEEAYQAYAAIAQNYPKTDWDAEAQLGLGKVLQEQKKYPEAIAVLQSLAQTYQGGFLAAEALMQIGRGYESQGDRAAARKAYQTVLDEYSSTMGEEARRMMLRLNRESQPQGIREWGR